MSSLISENLQLNLGWTLLHTIWQGALLLVMAKILLHFIGKQQSSLRYLINCIAIGLMLVCGLSTFIYLNDTDPTMTSLILNQRPMVGGTVDYPPDAKSPLWPTLIQLVNSQMTWLTGMWALGVLFFSLRFFGGLAYLHYLKSKVMFVNDHWVNHMRTLSDKAGITQWVTLAESMHINKPLVIGYIKPMILLPVGLLSGLPTDQVEAILLHELTHIRRNDFLINLIQSLIEVVLFFNPFVWIISGMIRKEREYYCDDQVIQLGSSRASYVKALANLEEASLNPTPSLALALNKNKYQVFNRIKRIMETSVNQNPKKVRPMALLILIAVGLACASWLSINPKSDDNQHEQTKPGIATMAGDTTVKKNKEKAVTKTSKVKENKEKDKNKSKDKDDEERSATYSRKTITTYDEDGNPHEEVIEEYDGDEELRSMFSSPGSFSFNMPALPSIPALPSMPAIPAIPPISSIPFMGFSYSYDDGDTIRNYRLSPEEEAKWEEFGDEMSKRFEEFGEKYENFGEGMEDWGNKLSESFSYRFDENFEHDMESLHDKLKDLEDSEAFKERFEHSFRAWEEQLEHLNENFKLQEDKFMRAGENMREYESALQEQLVKDGYLKKGDKVESLNSGNGQLTVNGIAIKEKDMPKYEALNKRFFKGGSGFIIRE